METNKLKLCFSQLPACVVWQLLSYLDTDTTVALAGVNTILRQVVMARFNLAVSLPFTSTFSSHLKQYPYSHNKPVLRLKISHLSPDYIRMDKMLNSSSIHHLPITRQLLLINFTTVTHLCLHLELTKFGDIHSYRLAFLAMLQSTGVLKQLYKLHLTVHHSFLLNLLPTNFGSRLMKDALCVDTLVITILEHQENTIRKLDYRTGLENFFSMVESKTFILKIFKEPMENTAKILINDNVEYFHLLAPCQFQAQLDMSCVRELTVSTSDSQCPLHKGACHKLGKCVLDKEVIIKGCPKLEFLNEIKVEELETMREKEKQKNVKKVKPKPCGIKNVQKRKRCGECGGCRRPNCEKCVYCRDMKKYGGIGRLRQACEERKCEGIVGEKQDGQLGEENEKVSVKEFPAIIVVDWFQFVICTIE